MRQLFVFLSACVVVAATMVVVPRSAMGQGTAPAPRTSWGAPDLQGIWTFRTITPLERTQRAGRQAGADRGGSGGV